jgi:hypothetical protein
MVKDSDVIVTGTEPITKRGRFLVETYKVDPFAAEDRMAN